MNICLVTDALVHVGRRTRTEGRTDMTKFHGFFSQIKVTLLKKGKK